MNFSNGNISLSDISGYITASEGDCDTSQYLSVLSEDITLEEMNVTLTNEKTVENSENEFASTEETSQSFIFRVDATNEIFGVQVAEDEEGNLQKYQIQYSEVNGELVPMLETIQFLPLEDSELPSEENGSPVEVSQSNDHFVITNEELLPQNLDTDYHMVESSYKVPCEIEHADFYNQSPILRTALEMNKENTIEFVHIDSKSKEMDDNMGLEDNHGQTIDVSNLKTEQSVEQEELCEETIESNQFEELFIEEKPRITNQLIENVKVSPKEEIIHILNNAPENSGNIYDQNVQAILTETVDHHAKTNILKKPAQKSLLKDFINTENIVYIQTLPEKENLKILDIDSFTKPSIRSILKCNQHQVLKQSDKISAQTNPQKNSTVKACTKEVKPPQGYYRTKEAKQARQFMNFINSTTIPQVPERKERLPRKQQIKPVQHPDENIVVKEMMVSSSGFVEPISAEEKKCLRVTEYVELLDSGDESNSSSKTKKKRKNNKRGELIEIEISDSDDSDPTETEKMVGDKSKNGLKKKRGRPPKNASNEEKKDAYPNSPPKISRLDSDVESVTSTLQVIRMESEDSGNVESKGNAAKNQESSKNDETVQASKSTEKSSAKISASKISSESILKNGFDHKFECGKCKSKFINKFLLSRHDCIAKFGSSLVCDICQQKFSTTANLNLHKKSHDRKPTLVKAAPKKDATPCLTKPHVPNSKGSAISKAPPKNSSRASVLPPRASVLPTGASVLSTRSSVLPTGASVVSAKASVLPTKSSVLPSRTSVLPTKNQKPASSVKTPRPTVPPANLKRSLNLVKSAVQQSANISVVSETPAGPRGNKTKLQMDAFKVPPLIAITPDKKLSSNVFKFETKCDKCCMQFDNHSLWFDHQVLSHGYSTPDKNIGEKKPKKIVKEKVMHNGIHAAPTVARSFSLLRNRVQQQ